MNENPFCTLEPPSPVPVIRAFSMWPDGRQGWETRLLPGQLNLSAGNREKRQSSLKLSSSEENRHPPHRAVATAPGELAHPNGLCKSAGYRGHSPGPACSPHLPHSTCSVLLADSLTLVVSPHLTSLIGPVTLSKTTY